MGGLAAGGDGWLFSAMFAQRIAGAADGRGGDCTPRMKRDTEKEELEDLKFACWLYKYCYLCVKPVHVVGVCEELCCMDDTGEIN